LAVEHSDGFGVATSDIETANGYWWTSRADWADVWDNTNANEAKLWKWDSTHSRPMLWFETSVNQ